MKTNLKLATVLSILFFFFAGLSNSAKAQCGVYTIQNTLSSCSIDVMYEIFDSTCSAFCSGPATITIAASTSFNIPCGACGRVCNVKIQVTDIGGNSMSVGADFNNPSAPLPSFCGASNLVYNPVTQTFIIQ